VAHDMTRKRRARRIAWTVGAVIALAAIGVALWIRTFRHYTPADAAHDLRTAAQVGAEMRAGTSTEPVERFLELRYGSLAESANRQRAFLDFFNTGHIEGLRMIAGHMKDAPRQARIDAMAHWIANYRHTMSPQEKQQLRAYFETGDGRRALQQAAASYVSKDVQFRCTTAPVIAELMTTVASVKEP
jgi:hypothetical protein